MASHSPTGFAFGMLLEVAAVVVIVSLLPRFDLRPPAQAQERAPSVEPQPQPHASLASFAVAPAPEGDSRPTMNSSPSLLFAEPIASNQAPAAVERPRLATHDVEQRLDQASQQLLNQLGSATASWASDIRHAASRPAWQPAPSPQPMATPWIQSQHGPSPPGTAPSPVQRRWLNY